MSTDKEFNLSDKIATKEIYPEIDYISLGNVKEFIRRLKAVFGDDLEYSGEEIKQELDALAGDKLK